MIAQPYDPDDKEIDSVIPKEGTFEAFYPREMYGIPNGASRAPHSHGSFFKYRHPALIESKNSAAYGYRFDGKRRFNFDWNPHTHTRTQIPQKFHINYL